MKKAAGKEIHCEAGDDIDSDYEDDDDDDEEEANGNDANIENGDEVVDADKYEPEETKGADM